MGVGPIFARVLTRSKNMVIGLALARHSPGTPSIGEGRCWPSFSLVGSRPGLTQMEPKVGVGLVFAIVRY